MTVGKDLRMRSLLRKSDGRAVIVAIDHGGIAGPVPGIESPATVIRDCVASGADAVLATRGKEVELPAGSRYKIELKKSLRLN